MADKIVQAPQIAMGLLAKSRRSKPKALGVLLCYNDADILPDAIEALLKNNHDLMVWDHGSDDGTAQVLDRYSADFVERQFVPRDFDFYQLYGHVSRHLCEHYSRRYDWFSWPDQDEILEGPTRQKSYYDYVAEVVDSPFNWVQFRNFNFWFTAEDDPSVVSPLERVRHYSVFADCPPRIRAWRASATNERVFNHNPLPGLREPRLFNLRHYPMRSVEQMQKRIEKDRAGLQRAGDNFHYNHMKAHADRLIIPAKNLHADDGVGELNLEAVFDWRAIYGYSPSQVATS